MQRVSAREITGWIAYDQVHGLADKRMDLRMAVLTAVIANAFRGDGAPLDPADFIIGYGAQDRRQEESEFVIPPAERTAADHRAMVREHSTVAKFREAWAAKQEQEALHG